MKPTSFLLSLTAMAICASCSQSLPRHHLVGPTTGVVSDDTLAVALEKSMPALLASNHVPGTVVSYIRNGEVTWTKAYGVANLQTGALMRPEMVFNHGSNGKVLTAWAIMRLVEAGKVELDAPANRYLKRWQIRSAKFDPDAVTPRRLLSHTAGLTVHGFADYQKGVPLPSLVEILEGKNQDDGPVFIKWQPGSTNVYSGGGFVIAQMIVEDVSGGSFAEFMRREVAEPLGLSSLEWAWTPQLERHAPTPYNEEQKNVGYRQLASQAVGSEICTVADFARFLAAAVAGPHGEPPGRGTLRSESIAQMLELQPNAKQSGLGYGIGSLNREKFLSHSGANPGWNASFVINVNRREGLVMASNSSRGSSVHDAVVKLWLTTCLKIKVAGEQR